MNRMILKPCASLVLTALRHCGIDVYKYASRWLVWRMWRRACPQMELRDDGLCVAADLRQVASLPQLCRDFIDRMDETDIPFEIFDMHLPLFTPASLPEKESERYLSRAVKRITQRRVVVFRPAYIDKPKNRFSTITPFWEFETGLPAGGGAVFGGSQAAMVFSDFCREAYARVLPSDYPVCKVRYPFNACWKPSADRAFLKERFGIPKESFSVMFHFNLMSDLDRKNPDGAIRSFELAFAEDPHALLVLKTAGSDAVAANVERIRQAIDSSPIRDQIRLIDGNFSHQDIIDLIASSDVYLSLHRGEGFGIGMLEAMSVGVPVVCTAYGGNLDFAKPETAFLVGYDLVPVDGRSDLYEAVGNWPEPRVAEAAECLRTIRRNPALAAERVSRATSFISEYFSQKNFEQDVRRLLEMTAEGSGR